MGWLHHKQNSGSKVRLVIRRAYGFHSAKAALATVMLACKPVNFELPYHTPVIHSHGNKTKILPVPTIRHDRRFETECGDFTMPIREGGLNRVSRCERGRDDSIEAQAGQIEPGRGGEATAGC